ENELPGLESLPASEPQMRQFVGSLLPMQLDAEEPLVAPKLKPAPVGTRPITAGALSATASPITAGAPVGATPAQPPRPIAPPRLDPAPRPALFSSVGETAEKSSSLRTVLVVGGLAAAATVGVMLLVTRPSEPKPPVPEAAPSASVVTPLSVQPPPSA